MSSTSKSTVIPMHDTKSANRGSIILFAPYYTDSNAERQQEVDACLEANVKNPLINEIVLLVDDYSEPTVCDAKIRTVHFERRPTYLDWAALVDNLRTGDVAVLANSDIYFDKSLEEIFTYLSTEMTFVALSRHEWSKERLTPHPNPKWSQDVWAVRAPVGLGPSLTRELDVPLGVPRCDNKVAYVFAIHGWSIVNPQNKIHAVHMHESGQRNYAKTVDVSVIGAVAYVEPTEDPGEQSRIEIDVWALNAANIGQVKLNKTLDKWLAEAEVSARLPEGHLLKDPSGEVSAATVPDTANLPRKTEREEGQGQRCLYRVGGRIQVVKDNGGVRCIDGEGVCRSLSVGQDIVNRVKKGYLDPPVLGMLIPPRVDPYPLEIADYTEGMESPHFWQGPCETERQAWENHKSIAFGDNIFREEAEIHVYVGLPWATYIDRKMDTERIVRLLYAKVSGYRNLARRQGYRLRVHTVCQHIFYHLVIGTCENLGITDLHVSHCDQEAVEQGRAHGIHVHSWPLIAVNAEKPERSAGLTYSKPVAERKYHVSFIGAHAKNYRSDARPTLADTFADMAGEDVLVELKGRWHFEKRVYESQVAGRVLHEMEKKEEGQEAERYNRIMSDTVFALCPEGSGPNTLRLWEALAVGAIPVVISDEWLPPDTGLPMVDLRDICVFWPKDQIKALPEYLRKFDHDELRARSEAARLCYRVFQERVCFGASEVETNKQTLSDLCAQIRKNSERLDTRSAAMNIKASDEFRPSYTWPNAAFPFRVYLDHAYCRIFIIENLTHNWDWLRKYKDRIQERDKFFVLLGWYYHEALVHEAARMFEVLGLSKDRFVILFNSKDDQEKFEAAGFAGRLLPQNAWLDEAVVTTPGSSEKSFDAIYVGRRSAFKRHWLAEGVERLAVVAGDNHGNAVAPVPPHAVVNERPLKANEVFMMISKAYSGLILSETEGACFASSEYLLCGVPVVSTPSKGGREIWYDEYNSIVCEPSVEAVRDAVDEFVRNPRDPRIIRDRHVRQAQMYREKFIRLLRDVLCDHGASDVNASAHFWGTFQHKMRRAIRPDFERLFP